MCRQRLWQLPVRGCGGPACCEQCVRRCVHVQLVEVRDIHEHIHDEVSSRAEATKIVLAIILQSFHFSSTGSPHAL